MTIETETLLLKAIDELKGTLNKFIETTNQRLTGIEVNQARLEGKVEILAVEIQNIKEDVKEIKTELKETKNDVSGLYKGVIGLILTLGVGIITLGIGVVTIIFKVFDLFPKA